MPSVSRARKSWLSMHAKGIASLVVTVLLCLPSLIGGAAFLINLLLHRKIEEWEETSSALAALGVFVGGPLVTLAAVVGGITGLSRSVAAERTPIRRCSGDDCNLVLVVPVREVISGPGTAAQSLGCSN